MQKLCSERIFLEGQKQTHRSRSARQISKEMGLTQCNIVQSFTAILV